MLRKLRLMFLMAVLGLAWAGAAPVGAALDAVGPVTGPHGFPMYYMDSNDLSLELCLGDESLLTDGWCFFDTFDPADPPADETLGVFGEVFWWLGEAQAEPLVEGGRALLVLGLEGTFGGDESVVNGGQISFGRVRVRVDVPVAGDYTITYPYGTLFFPNVTVADGINFTEDIGATNFLNVEAGFAGALNSKIGPFLTWPGYAELPELQVPILDDQGLPTGEFVQYVGNLNTPHVVVGGLNGVNYFRVEGPGGIVTETNLFAISGRVFAGTDADAIAHTYPDQFEQKLVAVGPINRDTDFGNDSTAFLAGFTGNSEADGYPFGYPIWYEDANGLRLTICPGGNPMCISDPINPADLAQVEFATGGETFWWAADAFINGDSAADDPTLVGTVPDGFDAQLILGLEGTFGGAHEIVDGNQISFGRVRIRIDIPNVGYDGEYTVIHPYGVDVFNVAYDPNEDDVRKLGKRIINMTRDIGIIDPADPDYAFVGAMYSDIGPNFLVWPDFDNRDPQFLLDNPQYVNLVQPLDINDPEGPQVRYVGDPAVPHVVTGGILEYEGDPVNYFRVIGPHGLDVRTDLFVVQGKVFNEETYRVEPNLAAPFALNDVAQTLTGQPVTIAVLANDTIEGLPINPAEATVTIVSLPGEAVGPFDGAVTVNPDQTVTYTPDAGFAGTDTFEYRVSVPVAGFTNPLISNSALVTVTVLPVETIAISRASLDLRKLRWDVRGTSTIDGTTLTIHAGPTLDGPVIGAAQVNRGKWTLRVTNTTNPGNVNRISIKSSTGFELLDQPLAVR